MAQTSEQRSFIVSLVKVPELNKQGKMRQGVKILTNQGEKWLNITKEPWLSPQAKNQSINFEVWVYNERLYGTLAGASPTAGLAGVPQGQEAPPRVAGATKAPQVNHFDQEKTTRTSIERQTAWRGACDWAAGKDVSGDEIVSVAQYGAYFIATGLNLADKEKIDREEQQAAADISSPPQREPGDDEPPPDDLSVPY